jgi:ABC-type lipoprotein release transport system permease subunit
MLFIGKAAAAGLVGAVAGYGAGMALALGLGPDIFEVTASGIKPEYGRLLEAVVLAPAFAALAGLVPALNAVAQDPAEILREE